MNEITFQLDLWLAEQGDPGTSLRGLKGVNRVVVDPVKQVVAVAFEPRRIDTYTLVTALADAGFQVRQRRLTLKITGMQCAGCALHVESALADVPGVIDVRADLAEGTAELQLASPTPDKKIMADALLRAGYNLQL